MKYVRRSEYWTLQYIKKELMREMIGGSQKVINRKRSASTMQ